jgi:hypothetical protein
MPKRPYHQISTAVELNLHSMRMFDFTTGACACVCSHNLILNGPTIGHTSSLFPFIDNDVRPVVT